MRKKPSIHKVCGAILFGLILEGSYFKEPLDLKADLLSEKEFRSQIQSFKGIIMHPACIPKGPFNENLIA